jgi:hypothetical protein
VRFIKLTRARARTQESSEALAARHTAKKQLAAVAAANSVLQQQELRELNRF